MPLKLHTFQIGSTPKKAQGLRIGAVRYLPRGVKSKDYARLDLFDVWYPVLAPSRALLQWYRRQESAEVDARSLRSQFFQRYEREMMTHTDSRQALLLVAELAKRTPISIGCYCEDESVCHRTRLRKLIERVAEKGLPSR